MNPKPLTIFKKYRKMKHAKKLKQTQRKSKTAQVRLNKNEMQIPVHFNFQWFHHLDFPIFDRKPICFSNPPSHYPTAIILAKKKAILLQFYPVGYGLFLQHSAPQPTEMQQNNPITCANRDRGRRSRSEHRELRREGWRA